MAIGLNYKPRERQLGKAAEIGGPCLQGRECGQTVTQLVRMHELVIYINQSGELCSALEKEFLP